MKVPVSIASFSASNPSSTASRPLFRAALVVLTSLTILLTGTAGSAQTAAERIAVGPIASVPSLGQVQAMKLLAPGVGWVLQQNRLYLTRNNGQDWVDITPYTSTQRIKNVFFLNSSSGWVIALDPHPAGRSGPALKIASTSDAGRNWTFTLIDTPGTTDLQNFASIRSMFFLDSKHGWIILRLQSSSNFSLGVLLSTDDGGLTWKERPSPPVAGSIRFLTSEEGWLAEGPSADALWSTSDGGTSWERKTVSVPIDCGGCRVEYSLPTFEDRKNGFLSLIVHAADHPYSITYSTHDAGKSWQAADLLEYDSPEAQSSVGSHMVRAFSSNDRTLIVQYDKDSVRTTIPQTLSSGSPVWVEFADSQNGWIVWSTKSCLDPSSPCSQQQELLSTTDGGITLTIITPRTASGTAGISKNIDSLTPRSTSPAGLVSEQLGSGTSVANGPGIHDRALSQSTGSVLGVMQKGFDMYSCIDPTLMQSVWSNSANPYRNIGVYIGGCDVHCVPPTGIDSCGSNVPVCTISNDGTQCTYASGNVKPVSTHLNPSDLNTVLVHWGMIPIWVGAQAPSPCGYPNSYWLIGNSPLSEGAAEADQAMARDNSLGIPGIIYYDMEYYVPGYTACSAAVASFLQGWVNELQNHGYKAGIYINTSNRADFSSMSPMPDSIWVAAWGSSATTPPTTLSAHWINQYCDDGTVISGNSCPDAIQQGSNWIDPVVGVGVDEDMVNGYVVAVGTGQTLSVNLTANPATGSAPLTTNLTATISGTASGTINYSFWWNCTDSGTSVSTVEATCGSLSSSCTSTTTGFKCDSQAQTSYSVSNTYSFPQPYTAKVIVERGSAPPAESRVTITARPVPTVTVQPLSNFITTAQQLAISVTVSPIVPYATPTGTVTVTIGGFTSAAANLNSGSATVYIQAGTLAVGTYTPTANYSGNSTYDSVSGSATSPVTVTTAGKTTPTVTVSPSQSSIPSGQSLSVTVTVAGSPTPTGSVILLAGTGSLSGSLVNGVATISVPASALSVGSNSLYATYQGDSNYNTASGSSSVTVTAAAKTTPTVTVSPSQSSISTGQSLSVTVTVAGSPTPTGLVILLAGTGSFDGSLVNGVTTITVPAVALSVGANSLYATYQGDSNYNVASGSSSVTVTASQVSCNSYSTTSQITGITQPIRLGFGNGELIASSLGQAYVVDPVSKSVTAVPFSAYSGGYGGRVSILNSQAFIPITNLNQGEVAVLNLSNNTISGYYQIGYEPYSSLIIGRQLYIGDTVQWNNGNPSEVYSVNPSSGQVSASINAGHIIQALAYDSTHNRVYALNYYDSTASAIDLTSNIVTATISLGVMPTAGVVANGTLFVVGDVPTTQQGKIVEVDTSSNAAGTTISIGRDPTDIVTVNGCAFVPNQSDYTVSVLDLTANTIVKTISSGIGQSPTGAVVDPSTGYVYIANQSSNSISILTSVPATTPTVTVTPSSLSITTAQGLTVTVAVSGGAGNPTPTGSVTLSGGGYTSSATTLTSGSASINIPAGSLATGSDTLTASYTPDSNSSSTYNSATGTSAPVTVTAAVTPSFTVSGTAVSVAPGATTGNTSTITVTPSNGFTGTVSLHCAITPEAASDPATCSIPASVTISGATAQTATLTVYTTAATSSALVYPKRPGVPWYAASGATLACILLFGIPARRRSWRTMLGMVALLVTLAGGMLACGTSSGGGNSGTTAGNYTITVTGTSGATTATSTVALTVQ